MSDLMQALGDNRGRVFLFMGCLMLPNVLVQLITVLRKRNPAPYVSFYFSLLMNCGYGYALGLLYDNNYELFYIIGGVLVGFALFCTIIPFSKCFCKISFEGNHFVIRELCSGIQSSAAFHGIVRTNRESFPEITVYAEASHTETEHHTRTVRNANGTHIEHYTTRRTVVTWRGRQSLRYTFWEEDGNPIKIDDGIPVIHAVFDVKYRLDPSAKQALDQLEQRMRAEARRHDVHVSSSRDMSCPGFQELACGTPLDDPKSFRFWKSPFSIVVWVLSFLLGYQSMYECFWCSMGERMHMKLKKRVSMEKPYRCKYGEYDRVAAEQSFRLHDAVMPIIIGPGASNTMNTSLIQAPYQQYMTTEYPAQSPYQQQIPDYPQQFVDPMYTMDRGVDLEEKKE